MDWLALRSKRPDDKPSVLIVEDQDDVRDFLTRALTTLGYSPIVAPDAEAALLRLSDQPHVALLDVHLPGASGLWFADQIRESSPATAIILATADENVPPSESFRPNVIAYLVKPFTVETLRSAVKAAVEWSVRQR